jgi:hypothetical protein
LTGTPEAGAEKPRSELEVPSLTRTPEAGPENPRSELIVPVTALVNPYLLLK